MVEFGRVDGDIKIEPLPVKDMMWKDYSAHTQRIYG